MQLDRTDTNPARSRAYAELLATLGVSGAAEMYEVLTERLYAAWLRPGDVAIDAGANVGRHAIGMAQAVGQGGTVHAFEPSPTVLPMLYARLQKAGVNDRVTVHELALGRAPGSARFHVLHGALGMSGLQLRELAPDLQARVNIEEVEVHVETLDSLFGHGLPARFVKLDLEGGELDAMRGGTDLLRANRPLVVFENGRGHSAKDYGYDMDDFFGFFESISYRVLDGVGFPFTAAQWSLGSVPWQFVALPDGDANMLDCATAVIAEVLAQHGLRTSDQT
ncbi:FkbM family methyltransferase [Rubrivivax benzoatilyticus]|uniref:FkbM family methyltransferase n=1 Tax=Rubrivivax benzoatilyticus TaxID=316997 RepID=A0ABX0HWE2_9BURK|nr:FkbM family methyltransferase [Rubrivivax benzoatilyticus]EGJ09969.1 methyltransferase FkbM family protein [Rubrivivax benzoatilyticus JA2 = ATCC BAA-35]NHK97931.1 FkbM family methyltransferase [Rubrivivax benzoatilyticus]NHL23433.1 FkbM family methyltransferase [Rubrivivax benzoatilyticus]